MRRRPKEIIEGTLEPGKERAYLKIPGQPLIDITKKSSRSVLHNESLKREMVARYHASGKYNMLHNHPTRAVEIEKAFPIMMPSRDDYMTFLTDDSKTMTIAQQDEDNRINGYLLLRKTGKTQTIHPPENSNEREVYASQLADLSKDITEYHEKIGLGKPKNKMEKAKNLLGYLTYKYFPKFMRSFSPEANYAALKDFCDKYGLQFRYVPAEGHEYKRGHGFVEKPSLESTVANTIFIGVCLTIAFLFLNNITGFVVSSEITKAKTNFSLGTLFILTLVGIFIHLKKKR